MPVRELNLLHNALSGVLPPSWGSPASNLSSLSLSENLFTGGAMPLEARQGWRDCRSAHDCDAVVPTVALALAQVPFLQSTRRYLA